MEKAHNLSRVRIKPSYVWPLEAIAMDAGKRKVRLLRCTAMLAGDDMIDVKR